MIEPEILKKARDLLALRDRAATQGEAEAAARALARMIEKYRIEITQLDVESGKSEQFVADKSKPLVTWNRAVAWRRALYTCLCKHYGVANWKHKTCTGYARDGRKRYRVAIHLCGTESDMATVRYMFCWLSAEVTRLSERTCRGRGRGFKGSWMLGFVKGIDQQLTEARDEVVEAATDEVALALRKRQQNATEALESQVTGLTTTTYRESWHVDAYKAGHERGKSHHLGQSIDAGNCRALPEAG